MNHDQVQDEKLSVQKALLHFEGLHGRPVSILEPFPEKRWFRMLISFSCTPDREILCLTLYEKFLSHFSYLTPGSPCLQVYFFDIGCIGRHIIASLGAHATMMSKCFNSKSQML